MLSPSPGTFKSAYNPRTSDTRFLFFLFLFSNILTSTDTDELLKELSVSASPSDGWEAYRAQKRSGVVNPPPAPVREFEIIQTVTYGNEPHFDPDRDSFPRDLDGRFR